MNRIFAIILCIACCMVACQSFQERHRAGIVAEVAGQTLTENELSHVTFGLNPTDSTRIAEQYIQDWAINILQYEQASSAGSERSERSRSVCAVCRYGDS